jgi:hypothetical protein
VSGLLRQKVGSLTDRIELLRPEDNPTLRELKADPAKILAWSGRHPDSMQAFLLRSPSMRKMLLCTRQWGKTYVAAGLALNQALLHPGSLILLVSPTQRQSVEVFRDKLMRLYRAAGRPVQARRPDPSMVLELANGSRVIALPGKGEGVVGYSGVAMIVIDEASKVTDELYYLVRPMLAVSQGSLVCLSTPYGKRGWFFEEWRDRQREWTRLQVTAEQCPRISRKFLREEYKALGELWYGQEYLCEFKDVVESVFRSEDIQAACTNQIRPFWE